MTPVAVLFARPDSVYKTLDGCDVWDAERDALQWPGGTPVVAHPPCRGWGSLRHGAKPLAGELELAPWAIEQVRAWGGVVEHPRLSGLWTACGIPAPGKGRDSFGGWSIGIHQNWFGHRAEKATVLYVVGCRPAEIPPFPLQLGASSHRLTNRKGQRRGMPGYRSEVSRAERDSTPPALAEWLVGLARRCSSLAEVVA